MSGDAWTDLRMVSEICQARRRILPAAIPGGPGSAAPFAPSAQARYLMTTARYDQAERELRRRLGYSS